MGVEHILTGYDHLIFLFGLLIAMSQFRATLWVVTCFTLAHSATLALAAFDVVRIPAAHRRAINRGHHHLRRRGKFAAAGQCDRSLEVGAYFRPGSRPRLRNGSERKSRGDGWRKDCAAIGIVQPWSGARPDGGSRAGLAVNLVAAESAGFSQRPGPIVLHPGSASWRVVARGANANVISGKTRLPVRLFTRHRRLTPWGRRAAYNGPATVSRAVRISCSTRCISSSTEVSRVGLSNVMAPFCRRLTRSQTSKTCA